MKENPLWLLPFYMAVATSCCYEKGRKTMRTAIVSCLLKLYKHFQKKKSTSEKKLIQNYSNQIEIQILTTYHLEKCKGLIIEK